MKNESYTILYTHSRSFLKQSLEWAHETQTVVRLSLMDAGRRSYNLSCFVASADETGLALRCVEKLSLPDLVGVLCRLYIESAPQIRADADAVSGKSGVFVCDTTLRTQQAGEDGRCLLSLDKVGHFDFRELRKYRRTSPDAGIALVAIWRCGAIPPQSAGQISVPEYLYQPKKQTSLEIGDISAGGARFRVAGKFSEVPPVAKGENLLCMFSLLRSGICGSLKILTIARTVSCQPVSVNLAEIRLQFTHLCQGTDKAEHWIWARLGREGVLPLKCWLDDELPEIGMN